MFLSPEQREVIKMHNKSIPWPPLERSLGLINCAAELYRSLNPNLSVSVHVSTVPPSGLHSTAINATCCQTYYGHGAVQSIV